MAKRSKSEDDATYKASNSSEQDDVVSDLEARETSPSTDNDAGDREALREVFTGGITQEACHVSPPSGSANVSSRLTYSDPPSLPTPSARCHTFCSRGGTIPKSSFENAALVSFKTTTCAPLKIKRKANGL
ncbi:hypothetical protein RHSIM_Rhsim03G0249300 [Rhododendron simsii]|uniref:Uncharacterized protein n=1 Tax=Rhododendron simsii TaxID=118357 RepID=A0A834H561_RHOSS|nr:hypothetical protein RHSIM_Rhsim03G0249300 [Rhododendron simsii]